MISLLLFIDFYLFDYHCGSMSWEKVIVQITVEFGYNNHGYNEYTVIANKIIYLV